LYVILPLVAICEEFKQIYLQVIYEHKVA